MVSTICLLIVMAVGYAAFQTNLTLKAKGNIKEKKAADMLIELCTTESGDGLYIDIYEDGKCTYKGVNPNNYITFNNETWRIISVENDKTIKIIKNEDIGNMAWDEAGSSNWMRPSSLNVYLNEEYLNSIINDKVVDGSYSIGTVEWNNDNLINEILDENEVKWTGKVGIITLSEYLRANSNIEQCGNLSLNNTNRATCRTTNWINSLIDGYMWTISPSNRFENGYVFDIEETGYLYFNTMVTATHVDTFPVLYLNSDITLTGDGSQGNPYVITN